MTSRTRRMKCDSGRTSASQRITPGNDFVEKNAPARDAAGREIGLVTADDPSAVRMNVDVATPRAVNDAAPISRTTRSDSQRVGTPTSQIARASTTRMTAWTRYTKTKEPNSPARYVAPGSGVARIRFSVPDSRRSTSRIPSPANVVAAAP